jgi:hypothetical protein
VVEPVAEHAVSMSLVQSAAETLRSRGLPRALEATGHPPSSRNAYLAVLNREPDANGLRDYGARVAQGSWSQAEVEKALRDSPEYKIKNR